MSEEALNAKIAASWESAGLNPSETGTDYPMEEDVAEVTEDSGVDETPVEDEGETEHETDETPVDDGTETETETEDETPAGNTETKTEQEAAQKEAEDDLAEALGLGKPPADPKKRAAWWNSRVPYSKLHKIVTEREKKARETHEGAVKEYTGKITEYDTRFADVRKVEDIITNNADQYVKTLAALFPDTYGKMFAPILGDGTTTPEKLMDESDPGPRPEPDYELPDGKGKTYSVEGYEKLMAWQQKVTEQNMLKRFKPHLDFVDAQKKAADDHRKTQLAEQHRQQGLETSKQMIAEAETWDLGKENINEILAAAAKLPKEYTAREAMNIAYRMVVTPKLKANRDVMHAQILKDMKKKSAKQTSTALSQQNRTAVADETDPSKTDVDTRIKNAWKRAGLVP